jgi:hypothetical protein
MPITIKCSDLGYEIFQLLPSNHAVPVLPLVNDITESLVRLLWEVPFLLPVSNKQKQQISIMLVSLIL